ncbi:MAG: carboxypeptidase regulatory-like domain-containing protein [Verrucomicrobiota bacterium]|jgi:hypothetical protein
MRKTLTFLSVIVVVGAFLLWWLGRAKPVPQAASIETSPVQSGQEVQQQRQRTPVPPQTAGQSAAPPLPQSPNAAAPNPVASPSTVKEWLERQYETPISFYGRVVDQDGSPLADASVAFGWVNTNFQQQGSSTLSDGAGLFSLSGAQGKNLTVNVSKEGYYGSSRSNQTSFQFSDMSGNRTFTPDPASRVLFHLRKKGPGAELITSQYGVKDYLGVVVPRGGTPVQVDLLSRKVGAGGQIVISQLKPPYQSWKQATEWTFRMAIPDGGFVEQDEEFPFQAPEAGYQPTIEFHFKSGETNWATNLQRQYYIAFGQPRRYGRLVVETAIEMEGARLTYAINPDGSRYLEAK